MTASGGNARLLCWIGPWLILALACDGTPAGPGGSLQFLARCDSSGPCGELECVAGACTARCDDDARCADLASHSRCLEADSAEPVGMCDRPCVAVADCDALGEGFDCLSGRCRRAGLAPLRDAGSGDAAMGVGAEPTPAPAPAPVPAPASTVQHARCQEASAAVLPALPPINVLADGRPLFDTWRDIACERADSPLCSEGESGAGECGGCLLGEDGATEGVCSSFDVDTWCDGEGEVIGYGGGMCWLCGSVESRARACCEGLAGFDCRAWPYPADGPPGAVCARHRDCEPGLVCSAPSAGGGYGICACPGVSPSRAPACDDLFRYE